MPVIIPITTAIAVILLALNAGFFFTWSFTVMQSLDLMPAEQAISAMQSINGNIQNAWFGMVFFGAPAFSLLAASLLATKARGTAFAWACVSVLSIGATVVVTMQYHVPWNQELAELAVSDVAEEAIAVWSAYSERWTRTNHIRTGASLTAFVSMLMALVITLRTTRLRD